jgi:putative PIN family toxin of toxin-antitoxin system
MRVPVGHRPSAALRDVVVLHISSMLRVVLDTNVLVSVLRSSRGASHQLLRRLGTDAFEHVISVALVLEYEDALTRPGSGLALSRPNIEAVLDYLCASGRQQPIHYLWRPALPDPKDDLVLEVAVNGECDAIVTFNTRNFQGAERFGVAVLTPAELLVAIK